LIPTGRCLHQIAAQEIIDLSQSGDAQTSTEFMEHAHVGQITLIGQMREGSPLALFGQAIQQEIKCMHGREQGKQMHSPELGGTELTPGTTDGSAAPLLVDEIIRNVGVDQVQQGGSASSGEERIHTPKRYPVRMRASAE
jgi:hypothetical protein